MEDRLISEYIGKDADKFKYGKLNWVAAIIGQAVGPVWFFYRKAYLLGFIFLVITYLVGSFAVAINLDKASYIMFIIYLFTANKLYLWDVRRKVKKIVSSGYVSEEELIATVRKKGGTSTIAAIIYALVFAAIIVFYLVISVWAISTLMSL